MNKAWHAANPMPPKATRAQRIAWHRAHAQACACRPVPASLRDEVAADPPPPVRPGRSPSAS